MQDAKVAGVAVVAAIGLTLAGCAVPVDSSGPSATAIADDWSLSDADLQDQYNRFLTDLAVKYGLDEPVQADFVRFVSGEEWAATQVDCLSESGFSATVGGQGGVAYGDIPTEQGPAQARAAASCEAKYPIDPRYSMQLPKKRAIAQYEFLTTVVSPCVQAQGYTVSVAPSEATWLDEYYTTGRAWDPFTEAASQVQVGSDGLDKLYEACRPLSTEVYPPLTH